MFIFVNRKAGRIRPEWWVLSPLGSGTGYYVDVFRSQRERGDKMHDYFYHNPDRLWHWQQQMVATWISSLRKNSPLQAHIFTLFIYMIRKWLQPIKMSRQLFTIDMKDKGRGWYIMNLWMKGEPDREVLRSLAPMTEGLSRTPAPYNIKEQPTLICCPSAWEKFGIVLCLDIWTEYEKGNRLPIQSVSYFDAEETGLEDLPVSVKSKNGRIDHISLCLMLHKPLFIIKEWKWKRIMLLSAMNMQETGRCFREWDPIGFTGVMIQTDNAANVLLEKKERKWYIISSAPCTVVIGDKDKSDALDGPMRCFAYLMFHW